MSVLVEIIAVGNELLLGIVQDTNTHWLCKQLTGLGGRVQRCSIVPDDLGAISEELKRALSTGRDLIVTTGGLGPTLDDRTLQAVAQAVGTPLEENPEALEMISRRYRQLAQAGLVESAELTDSRKKMAQLPRGAIPLFNQVGMAPGMLLQHDKSLIASLPGVPAELKDIFQNSLQPHLQKLFGKAFYLEKTLIVDSNDESLLAPILRELQISWPQVYIKSRPKGFAEGLKILITLAMSGEREVVEKTLHNLLEDLHERLKREGLSLIQASSPFLDRGSALE